LIKFTIGTLNQLGITGTQTASYCRTTGNGSFPDTYSVCSSACPENGETDALQNWTVAGIPLLHVDGNVYSVVRLRSTETRGRAMYRHSCRATKLATIFFGLSTAFAPRGVAQSDERNVTGIVTGAGGSNVEGACVLALRVEPSGSAGNVGCTPANRDGTFKIKLRPGRYVIRARGAGYPDPNFLLSADPSSRFPEINVGGSDISGLNVVVGSKGGTLEGEVRDRTTGLPIRSAEITIRDAHDSKAFVEVFSDAAGHFRFTFQAGPWRSARRQKATKAAGRKSLPCPAASTTA
jgi:hypothetical protein